jgi:folate-dependent phosphoribosylglycinamide formyltransferase PurN
VKELIFDPRLSGDKMNIVCFVSGSGTNYREIVKRGPDHNYLVFTNRPECAALNIARQYGHSVIELSHIPYLKEARAKYGPGKIPADCAERLAYEQEVVRLIEFNLKCAPDLICLAGYDLWHTSWFIDRYYPHIINVHPGDTVKGYAGLHWIPASRAIIAGEKSLRSTSFIVDHGGDTGPVLAQSAPLYIGPTLAAAEAGGKPGLIQKMELIAGLVESNRITTLEQFNKLASQAQKKDLEEICRILQQALKEAGDWQIYPFVIHDLISRGRVALEGRQVYIDGKAAPEWGYRVDCDGRKTQYKL